MEAPVADPENPEAAPKVEAETKRLGQFDISFADVIFKVRGIGCSGSILLGEKTSEPKRKSRGKKTAETNKYWKEFTGNKKVRKQIAGINLVKSQFS